MPAYDQWFDDVYVKRWGETNDTEVIVDHINQADIPARARPPRSPPRAATTCSSSSRRPPRTRTR